MNETTNRHEEGGPCLGFREVRVAVLRGAIMGVPFLPNAANYVMAAVGIACVDLIETVARRSSFTLARSIGVLASWVVGLSGVAMIMASRAYRLSIERGHDLGVALSEGWSSVLNLSSDLGAHWPAMTLAIVASVSIRLTTASKAKTAAVWTTAALIFVGTCLVYASSSRMTLGSGFGVMVAFETALLLGSGWASRALQAAAWPDQPVPGATDSARD